MPDFHLLSNKKGAPSSDQSGSVAALFFTFSHREIYGKILKRGRENEKSSYPTIGAL
jgi:hypothetical protein